MTFEVAILCLFIAYVVTMFLIVWRDNRELKALSELASNCPACILSAIMQNRRDSDDPEEWVSYDYKAAMESRRLEDCREL